MSRSETKEYIRDYTKDLYGLFKHGHRRTEHNRPEPYNKCNDKCQDYKTCQLIERLNHNQCSHYLKKGYAITPAGNKYKI